MHGDGGCFYALRNCEDAIARSWHVVWPFPRAMQNAQDENSVPGGGVHRDVGGAGNWQLAGVAQPPRSAGGGETLKHFNMPFYPPVCLDCGGSAIDRNVLEDGSPVFYREGRLVPCLSVMQLNDDIWGPLVVLAMMQA